MVSPDISIHVLDGFAGLVNEGWLRRAASAALVAGPAVDGASVSIVIAGDKLVRELNDTHRGLDEHTDVLAFSFTHEGKYYGEARSAAAVERGFVLPPGESEPLGEVIVSYPQALRQAEGDGHSLERELAVLVVHGVLHLLGHDHMEPGDEAVMKPLEAQALAELRLAGL